MSLRHIKRRTVSAMQSTVRVQIRLPVGMTRSEVIHALRRMTRNSIRPYQREAACGYGN